MTAQGIRVFFRMNRLKQSFGMYMNEGCITRITHHRITHLTQVWSGMRDDQAQQA